MSFILYFFSSIALFVIILYIIFRRRFTYWNRKGVYTFTPQIPFGNITDTFFRKTQIGINFSNIYHETNKHPYVGVFMMLRPTLLVNNLDLAKNILARDFSSFTDHILPFDEEHQPLLGHLFNLGGQKWKNIRSKLSPAFTTGKIKNMFDIVAGCASEMSNYLEERHLNGNCEDMKEVFAKFGNDVIANCAFGIECNTFVNTDDKFRRMGKRVLNMTPREAILGFLDFSAPHTMRKFGFKLFADEIERFFIDVVKETVDFREKNNIYRNDFMQLLIQLKNDGSIGNDEKEKSEAQVDDGTRLTMMQLAAQVFVFFIAGFETSSTTASFALYELALNPDIQATLAEEIDKVLAEHDGKVTYDSLNDMTYMTKVIEETMRKYPALPILFRICTKEYKIPDTDIIIEKGTPVMIPIYGIQRDPEYYPNPNKFDPERFSPENKESRHHFAYLPFGEGPRICIGIRFGMMQTKLGLATILSKYEVSVCDKTKIPIEYDKKSFVLTSEGGVWLNLKKRVK